MVCRPQSAHWVGTILLNTVELIERPSKKDGFCFKLFHPLEQSIWATKVRTSSLSVLQLSSVLCVHFAGCCWFVRRLTAAGNMIRDC